MSAYIFIYNMLRIIICRSQMAKVKLTVKKYLVAYKCNKNN